MPYRKIDTATKHDARLLLHAHWKPPAIASKVYVDRATVLRWEKRIQRCGQLELPKQSPKGPLRKGHSASSTRSL